MGTTNKKFTTLAKVGNKLFAPPYSESKFFDFLAMKTEAGWVYHKTGQQTTSRKYYAHTVARNNKIFFPPAGHDEDWSEMLVVDSNTNTWTTIDLGLGFLPTEKERKKLLKELDELTSSETATKQQAIDLVTRWFKK